MDKPIRFGKYLLLERINVGGMAEVFKAKAFGVEGFERLIAVKRILPTIAEDVEFIDMFIDEAKIAVQLSHANIAQVFDLGKVSDSYFIAMEYVQGKDVRAIFDRARKRGRPIPIPMTCYIILKMCDGLDYAHTKRDDSGSELNLVHRDVSPQNILISYDGDVKIIDFGVAKATGKAGKTQAGILKGKFGYMSPEQVRGESLDRRSDIFAMGIVLYELLTGERLFVGESDFSTLEKVRKVEIVPPTTYNPKIPAELEQIVLKALAKDVDERYQTALDLHDDIQSFVYTSGNMFSRKDLTAAMQSSFAEEIVREQVRNERFRGVRVTPSHEIERRSRPPDQDTALSEVSRMPLSRAEQETGQIVLPEYEGSASTTGGISPADSVETHSGGLRSRRSAEDAGSGSAARADQGGGQGIDNGIRQGEARGNASPGSASSLDKDEEATGRMAEHSSSAIPLEWEDDELSTQVYERDEREEAAYGTPSSAIVPVQRQPSAQGYDANAAHPLNYANNALETGAIDLGALAGPPGMQPPGASSHAYSTGAAVPSYVASSAPASHAPTSSAGGGSSASASIPRPRPTGSSTALVRRVGRMMPNKWWIAGAVVLLLCLGVGAGSLFAAFRKTGVVTVTTQPPDVSVTFNGESVEGSFSPFIISGVEPDTEHRIEVSKNGFVSWSTKIRLRPGATFPVSVELQRSTAFEEPAEESTGISIRSRPSGASIFVDGKRYAERTPARVTGLPPGEYKVRVFHPDTDQEWEDKVRVAAGYLVDLPIIDLEAQVTREVAFMSKPEGATVELVQGDTRRNLGTTPVTREVDTSDGKWTAEFAKKGYQDTTAQVTEETTEVEVELQEVEKPASSRRSVRRAPRRARPSRAVADDPVDDEPDAPSGETGVLSINTVPWSQVFVDGRLIGNTPQMRIVLSAGKHRVTLVNDNFNIREVTRVTIKPGETTKRVLTLKPTQE